MIKCPPFYFYETGTDIILGNNFLQLFNKIIFDTSSFQMIFETPCQHLITIKRLKNAYAKPLPISFKPRTAQRGDIGYKEKPIFPKGTPLLTYQLQLRKIDSDIEDIKQRLAKCYTNDPLQFWDKNQILAKLEMKDKNKIIRVNPMRYNLEDQSEFKIQIKELLYLKLIRHSNSSHSSPAFIVRNYAKIIRKQEW